MNPPARSPAPPSEGLCAAHSGIATGIDDLKGTTAGIEKTLTDLRVQLAGDLKGHEQSIKGAWKEIRDLRADLRHRLPGIGPGSGPGPGPGFGPRGDESTGNVDPARAREEVDLGRGSTFKIPIPKVIVWVAIAIGVAVAAGGWAWGVLSDERASDAEQRQERIERTLDDLRAIAAPGTTAAPTP